MAKKDITSTIIKDIFSKKLTKAKEGIAQQLKNKSFKAIEDYKNSFSFDLPSVSEEAEDQQEYIKSDGARRRCSGGDSRRKEGKGKSKSKEVLDDGKDGGTGDKAAYKKFFDGKLKKYGVSSPAELSGADKKKFYDEIDKEWKGDNEKD